MNRILNELPDCPCNPHDIKVLVQELRTAPGDGRVLGFARVRIVSPSLTVACGPWRVISRDGIGEAVIPPDVRDSGRWVPTISLPRPVLGMVEDAVLAAYRGEVEGGCRE